MTKDFSQARERLGSLSNDRVQLLRLLLEKRSKQMERIEVATRDRQQGQMNAPASAAQRRLWLIEQMDGGGATYHVAMTVHMRGPLDQAALSRALDEIVQRHEVLRTVFRHYEGEPRQQIAATGSFPLQVVDLRSCEASCRAAQIWLQEQEEAQGTFDLAAGPLIRGRLLLIDTDHHLLLVTAHHIVLDGWSLGVFNAELSALYEAHMYGRPAGLSALPIQYADYAYWQQQWLESPVVRSQLEYWREHLRGVPPLLQLPTDRPRQTVQRHRGRRVVVLIDSALTASLHSLARRNGMTLFMILYAAWAMLLHRLSGQEDIVIGTPVANRNRPELEGLIGLFVNTLVLRISVDGDALLREFLERVRHVTLEAYEHQGVQFEQVVDAIKPLRVLGAHPVFQVMFALQNTARSEFVLPGLNTTTVERGSDTSKFDLLLSLEERAEAIAGFVSFDTDLFDVETIERWVKCFVTLLGGMVRNQRAQVAQLPLLDGDQHRQVVESFNQSRTRYPQETLVHELFERQVQRKPDALAVTYGSDSLTYAQLDRRANQLAHYLIAAGARPGNYLPIVMTRSLLMMVAQLAVLKCGCAYVPVDPDLPAERRSFVIKDCRATLILADRAHTHASGMESARWIDCENQADQIMRQPDTEIGRFAQAGAAAYVMYTSGSTGIPKGVIVPHQAVVRLVINNGYAEIRPDDCIPFYSNPAFDASTFEVWGPLLNGGRVLIVRSSVVLEPHDFAELLDGESVTILWISVGLFNQYTQALARVFRRLRYLIVGGDSLEPNAIRRVLANSPPRHLLNAYGPTECTTFTTTYTIQQLDEHTTNIPIGRPIGNARVYVLDGRAQPVPVGVAGEIYIGGHGVACGYLNRAELTAQRFIGDPFSDRPGDRLYKTGDLARWRSDGVIEFLGRNDHQVKIRGFRIELGEIEAELSRHINVNEAAVVVREEAGQKRLVAHVTACDPAHPPSAMQLREYLVGLLPEYMVPAAFVVLDRLPLTVNGKLDRRALPLPSAEAYASREYEPARGQMEERLAYIWQELLALRQLGRDDNFFELGGHSLLAVKALFRINEVFGVSLNVTDLYRNPTVAALAERISGREADDQVVNLAAEAQLNDALVALPAAPSAPARALLLTGGTGFVGRFLLAQLLRDTAATIYCLVRASSRDEARSRLVATLSKWGLWKEDFARRIVAVPGDLRLPRLGIEEDTYRFLCEGIDGIYHCGTSMNHLETYAMAKPANVQAARELLEMATRGRPKLVNYVSTLSIFNTPAVGSTRVIDEDCSIDGERHLSSAGYAASKWVGEKLLMLASSRGIPCNIFRLGLVWADTQEGRYDELQRDHRIFKSCLLSGLGIRDFSYDPTPVPVDYVAQSLVALAARHVEGGATFHIASSSVGMQRVFDRCNDLGIASLQIMPRYDWIQAMKRRHEAGLPVPALPLIEFAFSLSESEFNERQERIQSARVRFDCTRTHRELNNLGLELPPIDDHVLRLMLENMVRTDPTLSFMTSSERRRGAQ